MTAREYEALEEAVCKGIEKGNKHYADKELIKVLKEIKRCLVYSYMDGDKDEEYVRGVSYANNIISSHIESAERRLKEC